MPPITTVAKGLCTSAPVFNAIGTKPRLSNRIAHVLFVMQSQVLLLESHNFI